MYFQIVDSNSECKKVYTCGELVDLQEGQDLSRTWKHSSHLKCKPGVEYAYILSGGNSLHNFCPGYYREEWQNVSSRMSSMIKSIKTSRCDLDKNCIYDFIPNRFLMSFLAGKQRVIENIFEKSEVPKSLEILNKAHILSEEMNSDLNLYRGKLGKTNYNIFGTKTGRLSNAKASIPILTMKKEDRVYLEPKNDLFVEFDFNAAELRTLLALSGKEQPEQDIHDWNLKHHTGSSLTREEIKKRTFAWLYNPEARDSLLESIYDRHLVKEVYWDGQSVKTPFLRSFGSDDRRALNYIVQSTSSDVCIEQAYKLRDFFRNSKTKVCYLLHDSVILDYDKEDVHKFEEAKSIFSNTRFGKYLVSASIGKNFGEMREV